MEQIKVKIDQVMLNLESGQITEDQAHIAIAEITTSIPPDNKLSDGVRNFMAGEIENMDIPNEHKQRLRDCLDEE